ncbi:hypothetical protein D9757_009988 [Collybiopsis confluens]|uniref:Uncharacterized protein n=1 Tax=Collybiopsis confluens TaxID=2823264 RepID=A0A8H5GUW3_9AGAR|nr:hypothetical protein D9757_009988 [Collybiopsis confluens]
MSDLQIPPTNDVSALKKIEKKIVKEGKSEDSTVSHVLKDLAKLEKASDKATKNVDKSEHALEKSHRHEHKATKDLNKATHKHDLAIAAIANAENDLEARRVEAERLQAEVAKRKQEVNGVLEDQRVHNSVRETKLAEIHHARAGTTSSTGSTNASVIAPTNAAGNNVVASPVSATAEEKMPKKSEDAGIAGVGAGSPPAVNV